MAEANWSDLIVEVLHNQGDNTHPNWSVGSGCFIGPKLVLTALHNVDGPGELLVRVHGVEEYPAMVLLLGEEDIVDLAVLEVSEARIMDVPPLHYSAVDRRTPTMLKGCWAVGFPRFKERVHHPKPLRLSAQVDGEIPTSENMDHPLLTLRVRHSPRPINSTVRTSEWEGMSGSVVFSDNNIIVGVISEHHLPEGESALTVVPITAVDLLSNAQTWWRLLGVDRRTFISLPSKVSSYTTAPLHLIEVPHVSKQIVNRADWGGAPEVPVFFGRTKELILLEKWIIGDHCRLVALVGMKGIGKTDLSLKSARGIETQFDYVVWRTLLNTPKLFEILADLTKFLSNQQDVTPPDTINGGISRLLHYLRQSRCLVILDNVEAILQSGQYSPGYEEYGQLFEQITEISHQSCFLLTSREKMPEVARRESKTGPVRSLDLKGLQYTEGKKVFAEVGTFSGRKEDWKQLIDFYNGNPLALELVARHIKEVFFGDIAEFLREGTPIFDDIHQSLLDWHFNRLSNPQRELVYWFAINREPTSLLELKEDILSFENKQHISSTLQSSQRLIPLEKIAHSFTLQPVLLEYIIERFIEQVVDEIRGGEIELFNVHALLKTSASDYVRDVQRRLILRPVSEKLLDIYGSRERLEGRLKEMLSLLREHLSFTPGYAGGNLLNLLCYLKVDLTGYNFSFLTIWQAYLQGVCLHNVNFSYANIEKSVFTNSFGSIVSIAWSTFGNILAAGTATGEIRLWNAIFSIPLQTLQGHNDWVTSVAFSPDGRTLASGSDDQTVRLWDVSSGQCLSIFKDHASSVWSVAFSPDGRTLASGSKDQVVHLRDVSSGKCFTILHGHTNAIRSVAFSPDGKTLASGSYDQTVRVWDVSSGKCFTILHGHTNAIRSVAFSPDGKTLASGGEDRVVHLWDVSSGRCINTLQGHTNTTFSVAFSPDGKTLASGSYDQTVRIWDVNSGLCANTLQGHTSSVWSVAFSPDGKALASGSYDQTVRIWDVSSSWCINTLQGHTNAVRSIAASPDSKILASGSDDQMVRIWDVNSGLCVNTLQGHTNAVRWIAFSPDGRILASGSNDQTVRIWDVNSGLCINTLQGHTHIVRCVAFSPDGRILASGSEDRTVRLWDVSTGQCFQILQGHNQWVLSVAFSPDGKTLASGSYDQTVRLWDVNSGLGFNILQGHSNTVWSVAFSPDGRTLASGSNDQTVRLWDVNNGRCMNTLQGHTNAVRSVAFSSDGNALASGSYDQTTRLWNVNSGQCSNILYGHNHWVLSVAFSFDGNTLVSGSFDGVMNLWDRQTGICLRTLRSDRPYERMNIAQVTGLAEGQKAALRSLGAIEDKE